MPGRAASPTASLNGYDISGQLAGGSDDEDFEIVKPGTKSNAPQLSVLDSGNGSDDEDFIAATQAASNRKSSNVKGRSVKKGGGFQAMGLNANLLKAITRKGFSVPTPIQRKTIPLVLDRQDVVGMARTGSGKTAAFVIPMIEKLKTHSTKVGSRALIMSPSRELALQTLKVVKELGKGTDIKCVLLVGGDSIEEQFGMMASNPDVIIATPGRFLHLKVEMNLDLSSIQYVVFDEADRLFEMGFAAQLQEILFALPASRQTLLFSATLPKSLVEFARAGLQEPSLVRLDAESKISPDLQSAFFPVKAGEKEGSLLFVLNEIIKMPTGDTEATQDAKDRDDRQKAGKKRKRGEKEKGIRNTPTEHSTIIFTATKHHVEYIANLLRAYGFAVSHLYSSLDQTARNMQVFDFRTGITNILVATDVAARGVDIPILANVINYDFPSQPKIYVHRVGRTARAGQRGWSFSFVSDQDCPYLLDLQLFLGKPLILGRQSNNPDYAQNVVVGSLPRDRVQRSSEWVGKVLKEDIDVSGLRDVSVKGEKLVMRTRNSASSESAKRAKQVAATEEWGELHPLFQDETDIADMAREKMLARISGFRPSETIFELGKRGSEGELGEVVKKRRDTIQRKKERQKMINAITSRGGEGDATVAEGSEADEAADIAAAGSEDEIQVDGVDVDMDSASESELEVTFSEPTNSKKRRKSGDANFQDSDHFMSYQPTSTNIHEERGYGVRSGGTFLQDAKGAIMDLGADEGGKAFAQPSGVRWDKRHKKYVSKANDEDGSKGAKMVRGESGAKIAASFKSGRFDAWRKKNRVDRMPRVGEAESNRNGPGGDIGGKRWRHKQDKAPKQADKFRDDYYKSKKKVDAAKERRVGLGVDAPGKKTELKSSADVRKARMAKMKRKEKTGRPSKKLKGR